METNFKLCPIIGVSGYLEEIFNLELSELPRYQKSVLMVEETSLRMELNVFIYGPGIYDEVMRRVKKTGYRRVNLFTNKLDVQNISDIYRLIRAIDRLGVDVAFYYPEKVTPAYMPDDCVRCQMIKASNFCSCNGNIIVNYRVSTPDDQESDDSDTTGLAYDIVIGINDDSYFLPYYLTPKKIQQWCRYHHWILVPFSSKYLDSLGYNEAKHTMKQFETLYEEFFKIISFGSFEELVAFNHDPSVANKDLLMHYIPYNF